MSARSPSGTFTKPTGTKTVPVVVVPVSKDRAAFCGCCCSIPRTALVLMMAAIYLTIAILSGISVGSGVEERMTQYQGQVQINTTDSTVKKVEATELDLRVGWLKFSDGKAKNGVRVYRDLTGLSTSAAVLGYFTAFLLLVSLIVSAWKFVTLILRGAKSARRSSVCGGLLVSAILLIFLASLYGITSRDLDDVAHKSLGVSSKNDIAMVPKSAWYCGFFAACLWTLAAVFSIGFPVEAGDEYHKF